MQRSGSVLNEYFVVISEFLASGVEPRLQECKVFDVLVESEVGRCVRRRVIKVPNVV